MVTLQVSHLGVRVWPGMAHTGATGYTSMQNNLIILSVCARFNKMAVV